MIIVEGFDNTGKTTLIDYLATIFRLRQIKSIGPASLIDHLEWIVTALNDDDTHVIYDRYSVISERVYGIVLREDSIFGSLSEGLLRLTLLKLPLIIYCRPPPDVIFNWGDRPQIDKVKENARSLLDQYDIAMWQIRRLNNDLNVVRYDYTQPGALETLQSEVKRYFAWRRNHET